MKMAILTFITALVNQCQTDKLSQPDNGSTRNKLFSKHIQCEIYKSSNDIEKNIGLQYARSELKPEKVDNKTFVKSKQPRRDGRFRRIPKPCSISAPIGRPTKKEDNPSFIAYGLSDRELMVGQKRTQAVYSAALRAQKRRKADIDQREEEVRRQTYRDQKYRTLFLDKMVSENSVWLSEYQRSFPGYNSVVYSCRLSSRGNYDINSRY